MIRLSVFCHGFRLPATAEPVHLQRWFSVSYQTPDFTSPVSMLLIAHLRTDFYNVDSTVLRRWIIERD